LTDWLKIGKVVAPQGLNGQVRIYPESDFPERFLEPGDRWIRKSPKDPPTVIKLIHGRHIESKNLYVLKFKGIDSRRDAETLRGHQLLIEAGDRPQLADGEFYMMDLVDLDVYDHATQQPIGTVKRIASAGNDLLDIELLDAAKTQVLVPFVSEFVPVVDLEQRRLDLSPVKGLLPENFTPRDLSNSDRSDLT
jgi:16S rRNA processing protein RimM